MVSSFWLLLVLIATLAIIHIIQAQGQEGIFLFLYIYILPSSTNVFFLFLLLDETFYKRFGFSEVHCFYG